MNEEIRKSPVLSFIQKIKNEQENLSEEIAKMSVLLSPVLSVGFAKDENVECKPSCTESELECILASTSFSKNAIMELKERLRL